MQRDNTDYGYDARKEYRVIFNGLLGQVLQNGRKEYYRRPPGVRAIVDTGKGLILQKEKREYLNMEWDYRLTGGKSFDSLIEWLDGYDAIINSDFLEQAIIRELEEEIGLLVNSDTAVRKYYHSQSSSSVEHDLYYFIVTEYEEGKAKLQHDEVIEKVELSYTQVYDLLLDGSFSEDRTRAVLFNFLLTEKKEYIFP